MKYIWAAVISPELLNVKTIRRLARPPRPGRGEGVWGRRALSERTGFEVRLEVDVDPSLIGGAIAKVGDLVFDGSIRAQLDQLLANLTKES